MQLNMGIVKIEVSLPEATRAIEEFRRNRTKAFEALTSEVKSAVGGAINQLLHTEMTLFLGRPDQDQNKRNGYQEREYALKGVGCIRIRMPVDRRREFESEIIKPNELTKHLASTTFRLGETRTVVDGLFNLTHIRNPGAAFGFLAQANEVWRLPFFIVVPIIALIAMLYVFSKLPEEKRLQALTLSLVFGGALGNLIDRARLGYVVDFLDFHWQTQAHFPSFNLADVAICIGVGGLLLSIKDEAEDQVGIGLRGSASK